MNQPQKILNASGYLFQLRVAYAVRQAGGAAFHWKILEEEYAYSDEASGETRFVDLILEGMAWNLVVECKRARDGVWVFPVAHDEEETLEVRHLRIERTTERPRKAWTSDGSYKPQSLESGFCAVRGRGEGQTFMLERIARRLLDATEAVAGDFLGAPGPPRHWRLFPAIITTAKLFTCRYQPDEIELATGDVDLPPDRYAEVGWLRFHKSLSAPPILGDSLFPSVQSAQSAAERTVFVINSNSVVEFLRQFRPMPS